VLSAAGNRHGAGRGPTDPRRKEAPENGPPRWTTRSPPPTFGEPDKRGFGATRAETIRHSPDERRRINRWPRFGKNPDSPDFTKDRPDFLFWTKHEVTNSTGQGGAGRFCVLQQGHRAAPLYDPAKTPEPGGSAPSGPSPYHRDGGPLGRRAPTSLTKRGDHQFGGTRKEVAPERFLIAASDRFDVELALRPLGVHEGEAVLRPASKRPDARRIEGRPRLFFRTRHHGRPGSRARSCARFGPQATQAVVHALLGETGLRM